MADPNLAITSIVPAGPTVGFGLVDDSKFARNGAAGWKVTDRPRQAASTEWTDFGPWQLTMSLILDGFTKSGPVPVEAQCLTIEGWEVPVPGSSPPLPPILQVAGPVPHNEVKWCLQTLTWAAAIRDPLSGARWQQMLDVVLWQYLPPVVTAQSQSPALAAAPPGGATSTYEVKAGDTLEGIASSLLGNWQQYSQILKLNPSVTDPNNPPAGTQLVIPAPSGSATPVSTP